MVMSENIIIINLKSLVPSTAPKWVAPSMKMFLSYPSEKTAEAKLIYKFVVSLGFEIWFDKESLIPGQNWDRERAEAQKKANLTLLVCSKEIVDRPGVIQREIKEMLKGLEDQPLGHTFLVPIRTDDFRVPAELMQFQRVDLFDGDWKRHLARALQYRAEQLKADVPDALRIFLRNVGSSEEVTIRSFNFEARKILINAEYIQYSRNDCYWNLVNSSIEHTALERLFAGRNFLREARSNNDGGFDPDLSWSIKTEEFFRHESLVSIRMFEHCYSGGAHGNTYVKCKNFLGEDLGEISFKELFGRREDVLDYIFKFADLDIRHRVVRDPSATDLPWWPEEREKLWDLFSNFSFDAAGITFTFSPYEVLYYAAGIVEVFIPWAFFKGRLESSYSDSPFGQLIEGARG